MTPRSLAALGFILAAAPTITNCHDGPTEPTGPYRFAILPAFGVSAYPEIPWQSYAYAIDPAGRALGTAECDAPHYACAAMWVTDGTPLSFGENGSRLGVAYDINDAGTVVGTGGCGGWGTGQACLWEGGHLRLLPSLSGKSLAHSINNLGVAVGWSEVTPYGVEHAVLWRGDSVEDLGTLGGVQSQALAINDRGQIVGWARPTGWQPTPRHAFLWQDGIMTDLGTFGGDESIAESINDRGQVVGWLGSFDGKRAFIWENGQMRLLPGDEFSDAIGLNNRGDVVGTYIPVGFEFHAALWRDGVRYDLNDLIGDTTLVLRWAYAINDAGEIVGVGRWNRSLREFGWRLTPTGRALESAIRD